MKTETKTAHPHPIYASNVADGALEKAIQLRALARLGVAASESAYIVALDDHTNVALFEVMGRLAEEIRAELFEIEG